MALEDALISLEGLALGDAFGKKLALEDGKGLVRQRELLPGPWNWTDDTQMALAVVEELQKRDWIDQDYLARQIAWRYSLDPQREYGSKTRQVLERIAHGEYFRALVNREHQSGSYGVTVSSRGVLVGAFFSHLPFRAASEARLAAAVTHSHPEALAAASAAAAAAYLATQEDPPRGEKFLQEILRYVSASQVRDRLEMSVEIRGDQAELAARQLCAGDPDSVMANVPYGLWCAAHHLGDFEAALWAAADCPHTSAIDSVCATVGGIVALTVDELPAAWVARCEPLPKDGGFERLDGGRRARKATAAPSPRPDGMRPTQPPPQGALTHGRQTLFAVDKDAMTGLANLVGLLQWIEERRDAGRALPLQVGILQLCGLWDVNRLYGRTAGDDLLRQAAQKLAGAFPGAVFREGDKFFITLERTDQRQALEQLLDAAGLIRQPELRSPRCALVSFTAPDQVYAKHALACLDVAVDEKNLLGSEEKPFCLDAGQSDDRDIYPHFLREIADLLLRTSHSAAGAIRTALTDSITQLPNQRAAMIELDLAMARAQTIGQPLSGLMIDGDNLRRYNKVSYAAGDRAIYQIGQTLLGQLRKGDFLARWRTGDEFVILLPNTGGEQAAVIGRRLCDAIKLASREWLFPTTISIGIAVFPEHGPTVEDLLRAAERGLEEAKTKGKNQIFVAAGGND